MILVLAVLLCVALSVELSRFAFPRLNGLLISRFRVLLKRVEANKFTGATYMAAATLACFTFFQKDVAISSLFFISVGEPVAALVSERLAGPRLWNKSLWGITAFLGVALATVAVLTSSGAVEFHGALIVGAAVAALVNWIPLPVDDNPVVLLLSSVTMTVLGMGWRG
jgi:dolichol kinase